jgi:3-hydroxypropanoate dehydrogenase
MLDQNGLDLLFNNARSRKAWIDRPVEEALLRQVFDLAILGSTSGNCLPMRIVFITSNEGKEKLRPTLGSNNVERVMSAPVTAIVAYDLEFAEHLSRLFPYGDAKSWFTGHQTLIQTTALRNGSLQAAYLMMAARAMGLDFGAMSGFDNDKVDELFLANTTHRSNLLCCLGYGDPSTVSDRLPRFEFDEVCSFA